MAKTCHFCGFGWGGVFDGAIGKPINAKDAKDAKDARGRIGDAENQEPTP